MDNQQGSLQLQDDALISKMLKRRILYCYLIVQRSVNCGFGDKLV